MATMTLDTLLFDTPEPERTEGLEEFMAYDDPIKIKWSGKGTFKCRVKVGDKYVNVTIPPAGKYLGRRTAIEVLYSFGRNGVMRGKDIKSGMTPRAYAALKPEERERYGPMYFNEEYLYDARLDEMRAAKAEQASESE